MRAKAFVLAATAAAFMVPAGAASAGGGCHGGATEGSNETVELVDACFTPTIDHVALGTTVEFVNTDPFVHNVGANGWGHFDDLNTGDSFTHTFDTPGVYPFACWYHPGMTGAIVVGDASGNGAGTAALETPTSSSNGGSNAWIVAAGLGLVVGTGIGVALKGARRPAAA